MTNKKEGTSRDLYKEVTDAIIEALETNPSWERPWHLKASQGRPKNGITNTDYHGVNPFVLEMSSRKNGFTDNRWATFKQASEKGIKLSKGSKGTTIYFSKPLQIEDKDSTTGEVRRNDDGTEKMKTIYMLKAHIVFNAQQFENFPEAPAVIEPTNNWTPVQAAEEVVKSMGVRISHGGNQAFYRPSSDSIQMPERSQFPTPEDYYATLLHEAGHATGHESRLARNLKGGFGSPDYAYEELIAEISSAMTSADIGVSSTTNIERHASYVKSWVAALKNDKKLIFKAAKDAEKVHAWVMDLDRTPKNGPAPDAPVDEYRNALRTAIENAKEDLDFVADYFGTDAQPGLVLEVTDGKPSVTLAALPPDGSYSTQVNGILIGEDAGNWDKLTERVLQEAYQAKYDQEKKAFMLTDPRGNDLAFESLGDFQMYAQDAKLPASVLEGAIKAMPEEEPVAELESKPYVREEKTSRYADIDAKRRNERFAEFDSKTGMAVIRDASGREVWRGDKNSRKALTDHMKGLSMDALSFGKAEADICTWMDSFFMDSFTAPMLDAPKSVQQSLLRAEKPAGRLETEDQFNHGANLEKRGLVYENGFLTQEGVMAAKALQSYAEQLSHGMPLSEHQPSTAPNKTAAQQNAMWGDRLMKGKVGNEHAWSNGHVLMVWNDTTTKQMPTHLTPKENVVDMDRVWPAETGRKVTPLAISGTLGTMYKEDEKGRLKGEFKHHKQVWFDSEQSIDAKYYDLVNRTFGEENVTWRQNFAGDHMKPLEVYVGEKRVGLVMGNRSSFDNPVPAGVQAVLDEHKKMQEVKPQQMWRVERDDNGMKLVAPGGEKKDIPDFPTLQRTVSTIVAYDNGVSEIRDVLEEQYWKNLPTKQYAQEADKLMKERYGVNLADAEPPHYASSSQTTGMHPGVMVNNLADKYNLQPLADVMQPYGSAPRPNTPGAPIMPGTPPQPTNGPTQVQGRAVHSAPVAPTPLPSAPAPSTNFGGGAPA